MMKEENEIREQEKETETAEAPEQSEAESAYDDQEKLKRALDQKSKEAAEANDKYLRIAADFDNYRKRMQRDMADFRKYANEQLLLELLKVADHLGLALKHTAGSGVASSQGLQEGVEMVYKQFLEVLDKFGAKRFSPQGEAFDPAKHDAIMQVVTDDVPENTVVQVFQDGYLYHDRILRHAKVGVSKKPQPQAVTTAEKD